MNGVIKPQGAKEGPISGSATSIGNSIGDTFFIDYRNPVIQQWNLNVQREVKGGWIIMAGYLGSKGCTDGWGANAHITSPLELLSLLK